MSPSVELERWPRRPANAARTWPVPLTSLPLAVGRRVDGAWQPARYQGPVERGPAFLEQDRSRRACPRMAMACRGIIALLAAKWASIRCAPLTGAEGQRAVRCRRRPASVPVNPPGRTAGRRARRAGDVQRGDRDDRPAALGQQDPALLT